jgi:hypothetical protein
MSDIGLITVSAYSVGQVLCDLTASSYFRSVLSATSRASPSHKGTAHSHRVRVLLARSYLLVYLVSVLDMSAASAGLVILSGQLADAAATLYLSARSGTNQRLARTARSYTRPNVMNVSAFFVCVTGCPFF